MSDLQPRLPRSKKNSALLPRPPALSNTNHSFNTKVSPSFHLKTYKQNTNPTTTKPPTCPPSSPRSSIRQLSCKALKVISSLKNDNEALIKASTNLVNIVTKTHKDNKFKSGKQPQPVTGGRGVEWVTNERYKTELCRKFMENSSCPYGKKCQFSHGYHELRPVSRHPRYRTELCREFFNTGLCTYGTRCNFIHHDLPNQPCNQTHQQQSESQADPPSCTNSGLQGSFDPHQTMETSDRPYTPNNDSGFSFGSSNPSFSSTPSSLGAYSPIDPSRADERTESPNELYAIPEEVVRGGC